jgi:hypothetical protein
MKSGGRSSATELVFGMNGATYVLRYFFEWGGGCLWPGDAAAYRDLGQGPLDLREPCPLPLSPQTLRRCRELADWHDTALNWEYPPDPGPWRQEECDRFNLASRELLATMRQELGAAFDLVDEQPVMAEDPDLDRYLADPKGFRR